MQKLNLPLDAAVRIKDTNSDLDGLVGTNLGKSVEYIVDFYIIRLPYQYKDNKAVVLPEGCLTKL